MHSIIHSVDKVDSQGLPLCAMMFNVGSCRSAEGFFKKLCKEAYRNLKEVVMSSNDARTANSLDESYGHVVDDEFEQDSIESFFENGIGRLPVKLVIIMDEFDKVRTIFDGSDFASLRIIVCVDNVNVVITSKRSIYDLENWKNDSSAGPSNLYQNFQGYTIYLKPFDDAEMVLYWQRLEPYFEAIGLAIDEAYKQTAQYYAGGHPNKLNIFNAAQYNAFKYHQRRLSMEEIASEMKKTYDAELEILDSVGLMSPAIQAIVGPEYDLNDEQLNALREYGFVRKIPAKEKFKVLGASIGRLEKVEGSDELVSYVAASDFFSLYIKSKFVNKEDFWPLWRDTFIALRRLAEKFFVDNWGDNWADNAMQDKLMRYIIAKLSDLQKKDEKKGLSQSPLIEYLNETILDGFLGNEWLTFEQIFAPISRREFFEMFNYLKFIRNHEAHLNNSFFTDEERDQANNYLKKISDHIDAWITRNGHEKLVRIQDDADETSSEESREFELDKDYEGEIVVEEGKWRLVLCSHYPNPLRIRCEMPWAFNANDKVFFKAKKEAGWWIAIDVRLQD